MLQFSLFCFFAINSFALSSNFKLHNNPLIFFLPRIESFIQYFIWDSLIQKKKEHLKILAGLKVWLELLAKTLLNLLVGKK